MNDGIHPGQIIGGDIPQIDRSTRTDLFGIHRRRAQYAVGEIACVEPDYVVTGRTQHADHDRTEVTLMSGDENSHSTTSESDGQLLCRERLRVAAVHCTPRRRAKPRKASSSNQSCVACDG